jgi:hypothetical protein
MVWMNFDWFKWFAEQEAKKLDSTVKVIYGSAYAQLRGAHDTAMSEGREDQAFEEEDRDSYLGWLEEEFRSQRGALAAMTFALLARNIVDHLQYLLDWIGRRFPRTSKVSGGSQLERVNADFQSRFNIDLEALPHFATVLEIVLARNSSLHAEGIPTKDYLQLTEARLLDETGELNLHPDLLDLLIEELKQFTIAVGTAMTSFCIEDSRRAADPTL